ncbi:hypothetical protein SAMN05192553_11035 [Cyclobacterium xiamenense]|uniref:ATP-binding protein n=1 Tax=Cyclobacterium xiamenense TaxID=1297121 RepID=A0A1H7B6K4_9BACT|nr:ATP-binding protein [Cyclobacterium xiamenense]SEJ73319.1 hypothetical protein SAMN05192553_11035 [Cyclobacterium xiamenense]
MVVLIMGLPGSGKSFFAKRLAKARGLVYLSSDRVRIELNRRGQYAPEDRQRVYAAMEKRTDRLLALGNAVLVDATFQQRAHRLPFAKIAKRYRQPFACIQIVADEMVVKQRLSKRREESEADVAVYEKLKADFDPIDQGHLDICSEDGQIEVMIERAQAYLDQIHEN